MDISIWTKVVDSLINIATDNFFQVTEPTRHHAAQKCGLGVFTLQQHFVTEILCSCSLVLRCELDFAGMFSHLLNGTL